MARSTKAVVGALVVLGCSTASALGGGCLPVADDAERFREPIPAQAEVALGVPGKKDGTATKTQGLSVATLDTTTTTARYYGLTRTLTSAVDGVTAIILGGIWAIVNTPPTKVEPHLAVWGPGGGDGLEPAIWRFTVNEVGDKEYDYVLEGQPKAGGEWLAVLTGHGYGKTRPEHRQGWFQANNDNYKRLEPVLGHDEGTAKVTYDLRQIPATIAVELRPPAAKGWMDLLVTHDAAGAGSIAIKGLGDLDDSKATKLEDLDLVSRWTSAGSGRADLVAKNGDLPFTVDASECWSASFQRVFYKDTVNFEPASGDPSTCALSQTAAPTP